GCQPGDGQVDDGARASGAGPDLGRGATVNTLEQRLQAELRAESELIAPGSLRTLEFRQADLAAPAAGGGTRRLRLAIPSPVAAAVAVVVIAAAAAVVSHFGLGAGTTAGGAGRPTAGQVEGIDALSASDVWAVGGLDIHQNGGLGD